MFVSAKEVTRGYAPSHIRFSGSLAVLESKYQLVPTEYLRCWLPPLGRGYVNILENKCYVKEKNHHNLASMSKNYFLREPT